MNKYTYADLANDFALWGEYFDTSANMTEADFKFMTTEQKINLLIEAFGPERK